MRTIEFRVYDKEAKQYYQPAFILGNEIWVALDPSKPNELDCIGYIDDDNLILEQFTGLYDKNGTKIFEGDVCLHEDFWEVNIIFIDGAFWWTDTLFGRALCDEGADNKGYLIDLKVIGNVHEMAGVE